MRLLRLSLSNFKGVKDFTLDIAGKNCVISGENATGKSTVGDALLWLLFDKNQQFKQASVKTVDDDGNELHGLNHTVEGFFRLGSGQTILLKKTLAEKWVKKRGTSDKVFSGHSTDYWVDEVPCKLKEYKAAIANIVPDEEVFKLMTSPFYFSTVMPWQNRRRELLKICGDIPERVVIDKTPELTGLAELLDGRTIGQYKKIVDEALRNINKDIQEIPIRIDEATRALPDTSGLVLKELRTKRTNYNKRIKEIKQQLQDLRQDNGARALRGKIADLEYEARTLKQDQENKAQEKVFDLHEELAGLKNQHYPLQEVSGRGERAIILLKDKTAEMERLRERFREVAAKKFERVEGEECPTCGQAIPEADQEESFNLWKSAELESIQKKGKELKQYAGELKGKVADGRAAQEKLDILNDQIGKIEHEIKLKSEVEIPMTQKQLNLVAQIAELTRQLEAVQAGGENLGAKAKLEEEGMKLAEKVEYLKADIDKFSAAKELRERIGALKNQERELAAKYEEVEGHKFMLENFVRAKVNMLEQQIIEKLNCPGLAVKMFEEQINGGLSECCDITYNGVPFSSGLNHGAQISCGIHIINMLSEFYGYTLPIIIDNAEAVTDIPVTAAQTIQLVVSAKHKALEVEIFETEAGE